MLFNKAAETCLLPLKILLHTAEKSLALSSLDLSIRQLKDHSMISHEAPLPRLEHTQLSLPLLRMSCAEALSHLIGLPAGLTPLS